MNKPNVLLVHGMGRTPHSMWRLAGDFEKEGFQSSRFGYIAAFQPFDSIVDRLAARLESLSSVPCAVIGHSLGGVMLRVAISKLESARRPRCFVMLGTPNHSPRLAQWLRESSFFRCLYGDSGQLLGTPEKMEALPPIHVPTLLIAGTRGPVGKVSLFGEERNDGIVSLEEAMIDGAQMLELPVLHSFMMNDRRVRREALSFCCGWIRADASSVDAEITASD